MLWEDNYLVHYGIKGQKWGVRRFQNPDGTLTEDGKKRYEVLSEAANYAKKQAQSKKQELNQQKKFLLEELKDREGQKRYSKKYPGSDEIADRSAEIVYINREKQDYENKANKWSQKLSDITRKDYKEAEKFVKEQKLIDLYNRKLESKVQIGKNTEILENLEKFDRLSPAQKKDLGDQAMKAYEQSYKMVYKDYDERIGKDLSALDDNSQKLLYWLEDRAITKSGTDTSGPVTKANREMFEKSNALSKERGEIHDRVKKEIGYALPKQPILNGSIEAQIYVKKERAENKRLMEALKKDKQYITLTNNYNRLTNDWSGVVLREMGFRDTPENRSFIWPIIAGTFDWDW